MHFQKVLYAALAAAGASAQMMSLSAALNSTGGFSTLQALLTAYPNIAASLNNATNVTVLAPSDIAIGAFLNTSAGGLASIDEGFLNALLSYHILNGSIYADQITNTSQFVPTHLNNATYANVTGGQVVEAINANGNVTFFSGLKNNISVSQANINFTGGVIHVIDSLLTVPQNISVTAQAANLTALLGAVQSLNLTETLTGLSDLTIFAPNNAAFQSIGSALSNASTSDLISIIQYHAVNGTVAYSSMLTNTTLTTLGGQDITISIVNGSVYVNSARVVNPDVLTSNGVVHVIDNVLNPNNTSAAPDTTATAAATPAFSGASSGTDVPFTSGVATPTGSGAAAGTASTSGAAGAGASSTSSAGAAMQTGAVGAAALFGGAVMMANW